MRCMIFAPIFSSILMFAACYPIVKDTSDGDTDMSSKIPVEYLNSQRTTGLPEHALEIKPNMPAAVVHQ